jgi:membrane protein
MTLLGSAAQFVLKHPLAFARQTVRGFGNNQGLLLASAIANYALLSVIPLLILSVIALSHVVGATALFDTLGRYLEWLVPSQSKAVLADVSSFLDDGATIGVVLLVSMLFFSSLAFSVLEKAMAVIFAHRKAVKGRHALISAVLPYSFVLLLSIALLVVTVGSIALQAMAQESAHLFGRDWSLSGLSGVLLRFLDFGVETAILTVFYLMLPVGRTRLHHAFIGAVTAVAIWAGVRRLLVWYFANLSKASIVYGSLTTAVVALFSMEIAATLLLFGAQVISEYERLE